MVAVEGIQIHRIAADGDLDGLLSAAILKRFWNDVGSMLLHFTPFGKRFLDHN